MKQPILIVDDSMTVRADLEDAFAVRHMATIACATLAEARAALAAEPVCLMILDVLLPDGDGVDFLQEVRATPAGAALPVLMLSTEAQVGHRIRAMQTGSNDYVGKPYDRDALVARAAQLLAEPAHDSPAPVLLIDDSVTFREQLAELLRAGGYHVQVAHSGEDGLRMMSLQRPVAVVVDGMLPGMDGAAVVRKLRLDAVLRDTPCILLTGSEDASAELRALDSGADAFVRKEQDVDLIMARLSAVLRKLEPGRVAPHPTGLHGAQRILAVDDSMTYLHQLDDVLGGEGYDVILAESGEQALAISAIQAVDCILLDRLMPGMSGTETCRHLKGNVATRDIPLIMLTATEDHSAMIEGLSTGADDYVLKSGDFDVLKARVRAQLRRKQFEDESRRIRAELASKEMEAAEMRAAQALAASRAELLTLLEQKNSDLEHVVCALRERQEEVDQKNRELEEASRLKSEFLSTMSHELRTPLNAIIGFSDLLAGGVVGPLSEQQRTCIGHVLSSGRHLLELINDILDLSKVEAGKMTLDAEEVPVDGELERSLNIVQDSANRRNIVLEYRRSASIGNISADLRKLRQIVYNLLSNAVKFSSDGGSVILSAHRIPYNGLACRDEDGWNSRLLPLPRSLPLPLPANEQQLAARGGGPDFLEIRVRDHGNGIAATDLQFLFEKFRQLDSSTSRTHEGSGLGLALVMRLAQLHGGTVGVASAPGAGSEFSVWLPLPPDLPN